LIRLWTPPATPEENTKLYTLAAAGDKAATARLIQGNIGLVIWRVNLLLIKATKYKFLRDDLISAGLLGLIKAANSLNTGYDPSRDLTAYLRGAIYNAIVDATAAEETIRIPRSTRSKREAGGTPLPYTHKVASIGYESEALYMYDPTVMEGLREVLDACCTDEIDEQIVCLRECGSVDREIAEALELPLTAVYMRRRNIYDRFLTLTGWRGEP